MRNNAENRRAYAITSLGVEKKKKKRREKNRYERMVFDRGFRYRDERINGNFASPERKHDECNVTEQASLSVLSRRKEDLTRNCNVYTHTTVTRPRELFHFSRRKVSLHREEKRLPRSLSPSCAQKENLFPLSFWCREYTAGRPFVGGKGLVLIQ